MPVPVPMPHPTAHAQSPQPQNDVTVLHDARVSISVEDDAQLARAVSAGDTQAFAVLVERHYAGCLRFAIARLGSRQDAEEAVQDAFLRAHRALARGKLPERLRPWLYAIVVNRCRSYARRSLRWLRTVERWWERELPEDRVEAIEVEALDPAVQRALDALPPLLREAFLLKHIEELTYEEIMTITGASLSALKMRTKRAVEQLAASLERRNV